jgi:hypothetical protein
MIHPMTRLTLLKIRYASATLYDKITYIFNIEGGNMK